MAVLLPFTMPVPLLLRSKRRVPSPLMELMLTVYKVPLPETLAMVPLAVPVAVRLKSLASTLLTFWLNTIV